MNVLELAKSLLISQTSINMSMFDAFTQALFLVTVSKHGWVTLLYIIL